MDVAQHLADKRWLAHLRKLPGRKRKPISSSTLRHYLNALSNLYKTAQEEDVVPPGYNPEAALSDKPTARRDSFVRRVYGHLGNVRQRLEVVEYHPERAIAATQEHDLREAHTNDLSPCGCSSHEELRQTRRERQMIERAFAFTGTRRGLTQLQEAALEGVLTRLLDEGYAVAHNGSAIGADEQAAKMCTRLGFRVVAHPSTLETQTAEIAADERRKAKAPLTRNKDMVRESSLLVACPATAEPDEHSGTWWTIGYAKKRGIPVAFVWPDGSVRDQGATAKE